MYYAYNICTSTCLLPYLSCFQLSGSCRWFTRVLLRPNARHWPCVAHTPTHGQSVSKRLQEPGGSVSTGMSSLNTACSSKWFLLPAMTKLRKITSLQHLTLSATLGSYVAQLVASINTLMCIHHCRINTKFHTPTVGVHIWA